MKERIKTQLFSTDLQLGMHVIELDRPWLETDFLMQGFIIQNQDEIDAFIRQCDYVYIEGTIVQNTTPIERRNEQKGLFARQSNKTKPAEKTSTKNEKPRTRRPPATNKRINYINKIEVERELPLARSHYQSAKSVAKNIMDGIRLGRALDLNHARETVDNIVDSILRNNDALVWLTKIKEKDEYTAEHSLNVCILSITFARFLGHDDSDIRKIGLGGLLHDVGKAKIPIEVLNKTGRFTDNEFAIMKKHPEFGKSLLMALPKSDLSAVDVAYAHHERMDGKGYPRNLTPSQIPYFAKIVALTDTYDAITSNRCYDKGRASMEALDIIYKNRGTQFDEELAIEFIKCIGIFPPGSIVELTNGEVAIVIASNNKSKLRPKLIIVKDSNKKWSPQHIVDLQFENLDASNEPYIIAHEIPNGTYDIDIREFVKKGLVLK